MHWLAHFLGLDNVSGAYYAAWSGFGGSNVGLLVGVAVYYRKHNCHTRWCPWWGKHPVEGTPFVTCRRHHPGVPNRGPTAQEIARAHRSPS